MWRKLIEMRVLFDILGMSKNVGKNDIDFVLSINDTLFHALRPEERETLTQIFFSYPGFTELYKAPRPAEHDLAALAALSENTLGARYVRYMNDYQLKFDWYPKMAEKSPLHFARNRQYATHDILHTITGFGADPLGELGLQGFYVGQATPIPTAMATFAAATLHHLQLIDPAKNIRLLEYITKGFQMGRQAKKCIFRNWENDFHTDITMLRNELAVVPHTEVV